MRKNQTARRTTLLTVGLLLCGCGSTEEPSSSNAAHASHSRPEVAQTATTCEAISDVTTIVDNVNKSFDTGRMQAQEQHGWHELVTRAIARIPSSSDAELEKRVTDLKAAAPRVSPGSKSESTGIGSPEWDSALGSIADICSAAGADLTIQSFTGG